MNYFSTALATSSKLANSSLSATSEFASQVTDAAAKATKNAAKEGYDIAAVSMVATSQLATAGATSVNNMVKEGYAIANYECAHCKCKSDGSVTSIASNISAGKIHSFQRCVVCYQNFCPKCIQWSRFKIPVSKFSSQATAPTKECRGWLCAECEVHMLHFWKETFRHTYGAAFDTNMSLFLENSVVQRNFFAIPLVEGGTRSQQLMRERKRSLQVADAALKSLVVIPMVGLYANIALKALHGSVAVLGIIDAEVAAFLSKLFEIMDDMGYVDRKQISGSYQSSAAIQKSAQDVLRLYYMGCNVYLRKKMHPYEECEGHMEGCSGITAENCPLKVLDYIGRYLPAAQWLYNSLLPEPHSDSQWSGWYLARLIERDGFTLLACVNETRVLPDGTICPAFALAARESRNLESESESGTKEAILSIRGSISSKDWFININEKAELFYYYAGGPEWAAEVVDGTNSCTHTHIEAPSTGHANKFPFTLQSCFVHRGMLAAARGILYEFQLIRHLQQLQRNGFSVKIVGHSLGAGVATLLVALLKNEYAKAWMEAAALEEEQLRCEDPDSRVHNPESRVPDADARAEDGSNRTTSHKSTHSSPQCPTYDDTSYTACTNPPPFLISGIGFACPACCCAILSNALRKENIFITVVNEDDAICRLSRKNLRALAIQYQVQDNKDKANLWGAQDYAAAKEWTVRLGKARLIKHPDAVDGVHDVPSAIEEEKNQEDIQEHIRPGAMKGAKGLSHTFSLDDDCDEDYVEAGDEAPITPVSPSSSHSADPTTAVNGIEVRTVHDTEDDCISISNDSNTSGSMKCVVEASEWQFVVPGHVLHIFKRPTGHHQASLGWYTMSSLQTLLPIVEGVRHHSMKSYVTAMRSARWQHGIPDSVRRTGGVSFSDMKSVVPFHCDVNVNEAPAVAAEAVMYPTAGEASTLVPPIDGLTAQVQPSTQPSMGDEASVDQHVSKPSDTTGATRIPSCTTKSLTFRTCSICDLSCSWPYILHSSDATKALAAHHCRCCNALVCSFCAPIGDTLPGDGIQDVVTLPDMRIALPSHLLMEPQRVCRYCYMHCFEV